MFRFFLLIACLGCMTILHGQNQQIPQEILGPAFQGRANTAPPILTYSRAGGSKDTLFIQSSNPFFDDFSAGSLPDSNLWDLCASDPQRYPTVMRHAAVRPPSLGAAMFDGVSPGNRPYERNLLRGGCDRLESHYIDVSNLDPDSDVWLSFFLQPQGFGHAPSSRDSFRVYFNAKAKSDPAKDSLIKVFSQAGSSQHSFRQTTIRISNPIYFHTRFYMVFESFGYQNGVLNSWHLDYVNLGLERTPSDTLYLDRSLCYLKSSPFHPYTAIPYQQYQAGQLAKPFEIIASNLTGQSTSVNIQAEITDPVAGTLFSPPYRQNFSAALSAYGASGLAANAFADNQSLNNPYAVTFRQDISLMQNVDKWAPNDRFAYDFRIDTIMAYDDGEADTGYGLNKARGFGQRFDIRSQDSLMAVWICFAPQIDFFNGGTMEGESFELTIWHAGHPDSILYSQSADMRVAYGDSNNHFQRYRLLKPISVSGTIYVGLRQLSTTSVGVGMDWSYDNQDKIYWDSLGIWTRSRYPATLMIRPELRNILFNPPPFTAVEDLQASSKLTFYPNPLDGTRLYWRFPTPFRELNVELIDMQGRRFPCKTEEEFQQISIPSGLSSGLYILSFQAMDRAGKTQMGTSKIWIR